MQPTNTASEKHNSSEYIEETVLSDNHAQNSIGDVDPTRPGSQSHNVPPSGRNVFISYQDDDRIFAALGCPNLGNILAIDVDQPQGSPRPPYLSPLSPVGSPAYFANDFDEENPSTSPLWSLSPSFPTISPELRFLQEESSNPSDQVGTSGSLKKGENARQYENGSRGGLKNTEALSKLSNDWVKTITELHTRLYIHGSELQIDGEPTDGKLLIIDEVFLLSQHLLDIYSQNRPNLCHNGTLPRASPVANNYNVRSSDSNQPKNFTTSETSSSRKQRPDIFPMLHDPASIFLLISSRLRLLNIYQNLLQRLERWKASSGASAQVPNFNAGPFSIALQASPNLRAIFILQLMEYFLFRLRKEPADIESPGNAFSNGASLITLSNVADTALEEVKIKEVETLTTIRKLQRTIQVG
ncbi:hypothetical protein TWF481_007364 [Arthrobotrys musiformis]|uniref:Aflatoxin regulatory protein domain-containing protein n=1 Tax=Arthrobotrys musiformis TaxID=47236 RepID=A0AAV9WC41_9PEZI